MTLMMTQHHSDGGCGAMDSPYYFFVGDKFGRLTVTNDTISGKLSSNNRTKIPFLCSCGNTAYCTWHNASSGNVKSCGCLRKENSKSLHKTHGMCGSSVYGIWNAMVCRCAGRRSKGHPDYIVKRITVCEKWLTFDGFWEDMGSTYLEGLSIDRIDNDQGYSKENCRWTTPLVQAHNKGLYKSSKSGVSGVIKTKWNTYRTNVYIDNNRCCFCSKTFDEAVAIKQVFLAILYNCGLLNFLTEGMNK